MTMAPQEPVDATPASHPDHHVWKENQSKIVVPANGSTLENNNVTHLSDSEQKPSSDGVGTEPMEVDGDVPATNHVLASSDKDQQHVDTDTPSPNPVAEANKPAEQPNKAQLANGNAPVNGSDNNDAAAAPILPADTPQPVADADAAPTQQTPAEDDPAVQAARLKASQALEGILNKVSLLDNEGWFQHPVSETIAPNYYKIIKQPMCFQMMRNKLANKVYLKWTDFVKDFDLICNNAIKFNQKRSRVHKAAMILTRNGRKHLAEFELEGRRSFAVLHPDHHPGAQHDLLQDINVSHLPKVGIAPRPPLAPGSTTPATGTTGGLLYMTGATPGSGFIPPGSNGAAAVLKEGSLDFGADVDAANQRHAVEPGYSSYDDASDDDTNVDEEEVVVSPVNKKRKIEGGVQKKEQRQQQPVLGIHAQPAVVVEPWGSSAAPLQEPAIAATEEWKGARKNIKFRMQWLELRVKELGHHRTSLLQKQEKLAAAKTTATAGDAPAAADKSTEHGAKTAAADGNASTEPAVDTATKKNTLPHRERKPHPQLELPALLTHPFYADHSIIGTRDASTAAPQPATASMLEDPHFPAKAHASLAMLTHQLNALKQQITALQQPQFQGGNTALFLQQQQRGGRWNGRGSGGARGAAAARGTGSGSFNRNRNQLTGQGSTPRLSSGGGVPRQNSFSRGEDAMGMRTLKRRRTVTDSEFEMVITPGMLGTPKYVERVVPKTIGTPKVNTLSHIEVKKRLVAVESYNKGLKEGKSDVDALAAIKALCAGESSDEEDISDEAFAKRHEKMEEEERARYTSVVTLPGSAADKQQQRARQQQQQQQQQQNGGASNGNGTVPRMQLSTKAQYVHANGNGTAATANGNSADDINTTKKPSSTSPQSPHPASPPQTEPNSFMVASLNTGQLHKVQVNGMSPVGNGGDRAAVMTMRQQLAVMAKSSGDNSEDEDDDDLDAPLIGNGTAAAGAMKAEANGNVAPPPPQQPAVVALNGNGKTPAAAAAVGKGSGRPRGRPPKAGRAAK